ncbi:hypothetical protein [Tritonibacter multivorans]|nr:hypothetical protein [Tritonibacter multivorans]
MASGRTVVVVVEVLRVTGAHMTVHASVMRRVDDSLFASHCAAEISLMP